MRRLGTRKNLGALFASYPVPANSDYFPFVDLNAPRFRFLRRNALPLGGLNLRPLPLLPLLGESEIAPRSQPTAGADFYYRAGQVNQAFALRLAIESGHLRALPLSEAKDVIALRTPAERCEDGGIKDTWLHAVKSIAGHTTPHLAPGDLTSIWEAVRNSPCYSRLDAQQHAWVDYLETLARRDRKGIVAQGTELLKDDSARNPDLRSDLIVAMSAALLGENDIEGLETLMRSELAFIQSRASSDLALRLIESLVIEKLANTAR